MNEIMSLGRLEAAEQLRQRTGVEQTVFQWDGAQLIPVTFTVG